MIKIILRQKPELQLARNQYRPTDRFQCRSVIKFNMAFICLLCCPLFARASNADSELAGAPTHLAAALPEILSNTVRWGRGRDTEIRNRLKGHEKETVVFFTKVHFQTNAPARLFSMSWEIFRLYEQETFQELQRYLADVKEFDHEQQRTLRVLGDQTHSPEFMVFVIDMLLRDDKMREYDMALPLGRR